MNQNLPAKYALPGPQTIGSQIMYDKDLLDQCKYLAGVLSRSEGFVPPHLAGKIEACFAVVVKSLTWHLDMYSVATSTYMTPGGKVGYEGKLIQAILENSGSLEGNVKYELIGDWSKISGKFSMNGKVPVQGWKPEDEKGLGVVVSAQVKGEAEPRTMEFMMVEAFPRFSTLWIIRPSQQIKYAACRAFANTVTPGIFFGVPFEEDIGTDRMVDITPADSQITDPLELAYEAGRKAYRDKVRFRDAPNLKPAEYQQWTKGYKAEMDLDHGEAENVEYEARKAKEEADASVESAETSDEPAAEAKPEKKADPEPADGTLPLDTALADLKAADNKPATAKPAQAAKAGKAAPKADAKAGNGSSGQVAVPEGVEKFADLQYQQGVLDDLDAAQNVDGLHDAYAMYEDDAPNWPSEFYKRVGAHFEKRLDDLEKKV